MNWTIFTAIFTAITAIATFVAAGVALWIACTEQWRQEKHRQKILNSQKCDLILVPTKEWNYGAQYQKLLGELSGFNRKKEAAEFARAQSSLMDFERKNPVVENAMQQAQYMCDNSIQKKYFQGDIIFIAPSELHWLNSERIYGVNIKPGISIMQVKNYLQTTQYFKEVFITEQGKKRDEKDSHIPTHYKKENVRDGNEKIKNEDAMNEKTETPQKEDIDANITEQTIKRWVDGLLKYVPSLTFLSSIYIACMSWAIERYLKKYNIGYVNAQFPSKAQIINGIIAACVTMLTALWVAPYYQALIKQEKKGLVKRFIIYIVGYTILFIGMFLGVAFSTLKGLGIADIGSIFVSLIREPSNIFALCVCIFLLIIVTGACEWLIKKGKIIKLSHILIIFAVIAMYAVMLLQIINKSESTLYTVHIRATDEMKTWTENAPIADDGKQIWAVVYESKDSYFVEPLTSTADTDANDAEERAEIRNQYKVDKEHYMALNKADVIIYNKTVGDLNDEIKKKDQKSMECK